MKPKKLTKCIGYHHCEYEHFDKKNKNCQMCQWEKKYHDIMISKSKKIPANT